MPLFFLGFLDRSFFCFPSFCCRSVRRRRESLVRFLHFFLVVVSGSLALGPGIQDRPRGA